MTTTVDYYDFCGSGFSRRYLGTQTYRVGATVRQSRTLSDGRFVETNPFRLQVEGAASGFGLSLLSSSVVRTPLTGRRLLLVYWGLARRGAAVAGRLLDTHREEGAEANHLRAWGPPLTSGCGVGISHVYPVDLNASFQGGITAGAANLTITGRSRDTLRVFRSVVRTTR
jgi:hypothetical protein